MDLDTASTADRLGVSRQEVRRLARERILLARRIGRSYLFDEHSVDARLAQKPPRGRPLTPGRAWAVLWLLAGRSVDWLDASSRAKVHAWLLEHAGVEPDAFAMAVRPRADLFRRRALPAHLERLAQEPGVVVGGLAAIGDQAALSGGRPVLYCDRGTRERLEISYGLRSDPDVNVVLLESRFPLERLDPGPAMPAIVGAVDLLVSAAARERTVGATVVRRALAAIR